MANNPSQNPESSQPIKQDENGTFWYFAIGAMMNPISIKNRGIVPIESHPGELLDFNLHFFGSMGIAQAVKCPGESFHGVLHVVTKEAMAKLDALEIEYVRTPATARLYNGTIVDTTVYTKPDSYHRGADKPPSERYLEIMSRGAKHYGVKQEYIEFLENHVSTPRPLPHELRSFDDPPTGVFMSLQEVALGDGENKDYPLRFTLNGKVLEVRVPRDSKDWKDFSGPIKCFGQHMELVLSRVVYDPKYGIPERLNDCTREHAANMEDHLVKFVESRNCLDSWKTVASYQQEFAD